MTAHQSNHEILDDECNVLANHYDLADRHGLDRHQRKGVDALIVQRMPGCSNSDCDLSLSVIPFPPPRSFLSVWFRAQRAPA
jgi:hypothetical protein